VQALPQKGFCCWRKYFQPLTASLRSSSCKGTRARETRLIKLQLSNLTAKDSSNLCNCWEFILCFHLYLFPSMHTTWNWRCFKVEQASKWRFQTI
jgi:hypothetical protein